MFLLNHAFCCIDSAGPYIHHAALSQASLRKWSEMCTHVYHLSLIATGVTLID